MAKLVSETETAVVSEAERFAAFADGRFTTSVNPMPNPSRSPSCCGPSTSTPRRSRTRALRRDAENAGQNRLVDRAN